MQRGTGKGDDRLEAETAKEAEVAWKRRRTAVDVMGEGRVDRRAGEDDGEEVWRDEGRESHGRRSKGKRREGEDSVSADEGSPYGGSEKEEEAWSGSVKKDHVENIEILFTSEREQTSTKRSAR